MINFSERITIDEMQPLPEFDSGAGRAYAAQSKTNNSNALIALIVQGQLPTRINLLSAFHGLSHPGLNLVHEAKVVDWPLSGQRQMAIIYDVIPGKRMAPFPANGEAAHGIFQPIKDTVVIDRFIKPLGQAICYLHKMGLFHGSIRADNIFLADGNNVTLGDCLSAPCAYRQPVQYETLQRGLAPDIARGPGTPGDDLYAFGVAILAAMTGDIPLRGLSDEAIVQMKTERGSYAALAGERRFTQGISELLHGLLNDDPHSRWNNDDFDHWLLGRRLTPRPAAISKKANRPFRFAGQDYLQVRQLLNAMTNDTKLAAAHISNQDLTRWMSHFSDEKIIKNLENAINSTRQQRFGSDEERLVSNVQMALDPLAPIRYRGISVFPGALPALLAHMILTEAPLTVFAEMLVNKLPSLWLDNQSDKPSDVIVAVQLCEKATSMLQNKMLGFGIERFLYDSNPSLPCFNPQLRERYVLNPKQLLESMERRAPLGGLQLVDRHIAAFLMARDKSVPTSLMALIDQMRDMTARNIAILNFYSNLQERHGPDQLKNLAALLLPLTEEAVKRFHNRPRQERVRKELKTAAATGKLRDLLALVDDPNTVRLDEQEFVAAKMLYQETESEVARLQSYAKNRKLLAEQAGQPLAAVIAVGLSFFLLLIILLRLFQ